MANAKTVALLVGATAINKAIASIKNRGAKLDADIQHAGLSVLAHVDAHGDTTVADSLINAMPKGGRRLALAEWLLANGKLRKLDGKDKDDAARMKAGAHFAYAKDRRTDMQAATEKPWYDHKKEAAVSSAYDAQAALAKVLARVTGGAIADSAAALVEARKIVAFLEKLQAPAEASDEALM